MDPITKLADAAAEVVADIDEAGLLAPLRALVPGLAGHLDALDALLLPVLEVAPCKLTPSTPSCEGVA